MIGDKVVHGWLPEDEQTKLVMQKLTYNDAVEMVALADELEMRLNESHDNNIEPQQQDLLFRAGIVKVAPVVCFAEWWGISDSCPATAFSRVEPVAAHVRGPVQNSRCSRRRRARRAVSKQPLFDGAEAAQRSVHSGDRRRLYSQRRGRLGNAGLSEWRHASCQLRLCLAASAVGSVAACNCVSDSKTSISFFLFFFSFFLSQLRCTIAGFGTS